MPTFRIITVDTTYDEGDSLSLTLNFQAPVDKPSPTLKSYRHEGDYVVLVYSGGLELSIPEHRIKYIAEQTA
ncbi:hypothetical protein [Streptomyces sp. NPDC048272]|uniref:hypothetical protein n=1 Tax=Streptomyces sp. NPDC048272 TaxID=3154616 RepID=UPI00342999E5